MKLIIKFFSFLFLFSILYFLSSATISAQTNFTVPDIPKITEAPTPAPNYVPINTNPDVPLNMHTWTQSLFIESVAAFSCQLTGVDPTNPNQKCLGIDTNTGKIGFVENGGGVLKVFAGFMADLHTPPIRTSEYTNYLAQNFGIAKSAYAQQPCTQGIGFCGIKPLMGIWKTMRDAIYLLFIIVFIFIGIAIMLRIKIDPRTVMTIENQIPKLIIGLVFITFSFAIAGLLIDFMYVVTALLINIFSPLGGQANPITLADVQSTNVFEFYNKSMGRGTELAGLISIPGWVNVAWNGSGSFGDMMGNMLGPWDKILGAPIYGALTYLAAHLPLVKQIPLAFVSFFKTLEFGLPLGILNVKLEPKELVNIYFSVAAAIPLAFLGFTSFAKVLAFIIITFAVFWSLVRIFFMLLLAYVYILIDITLAPFIIVIGLVPNGPGFTAWLRDLIANLAAFPTVIAIFLLGRTFMFNFGLAQKDVSGRGIFVPPLLGNQADANNLQFLIGLAILLIAPKAIEMTRDTFKAPEFKYAAGIGQALGAGGGALRADKMAAGLGSQLFGLSHFGPSKKLLQKFKLWE